MKRKPIDITSAAALLGAKGGSVSSEAKTAAARANATKPRNKKERALKPFDQLSRAQQWRRRKAEAAQGSEDNGT